MATLPIYALKFQHSRKPRRQGRVSNNLGCVFPNFLGFFGEKLDVQWPSIVWGGGYHGTRDPGEMVVHKRQGVAITVGYALDIAFHLPCTSAPTKYCPAVVVAEMSGDVWMLPRPFELKGGELGGEAVNNHLHDPWSVVLSLPRALGDLAVVLASTSGQPDT